MNFKNWLESIDLKKPLNKVKKQNIIKDKGTNVARRIVQYSYTTKLGNIVKLQFEPKEDNEYDVVFYVNDVLYDNAPLMNIDNKEEKYSRDSEILPTVFFLLNNKANSLKAKYLTFRAHSSPKDTKIVRNLDIEEPKNQVLLDLNYFESKIKLHIIKFIEPSEITKNLYRKLDKPIPEARPDLDKSLWLNWIEKLKLAIENNQDLQEYIDNLITFRSINHKYIIENLNIDNLISSLRNLNNAINSNTEKGYSRTINRRASIYKRILDKDFSKYWNIQQDGDRFTLTRKNENI